MRGRRTSILTSGRRTAGTGVQPMAMASSGRRVRGDNEASVTSSSAGMAMLRQDEPDGKRCDGRVHAHVALGGGRWLHRQGSTPGQRHCARARRATDGRAELRFGAMSRHAGQAGHAGCRRPPCRLPRHGRCCERAASKLRRLPRTARRGGRALATLPRTALAGRFALAASHAGRAAGGAPPRQGTSHAIADIILSGLAALTTPSRRLHGADRADCAREQIAWGLGVEMGEKNGEVSSSSMDFVSWVPVGADGWLGKRNSRQLRH
jgi:hypothetical protein